MLARSAVDADVRRRHLPDDPQGLSDATATSTSATRPAPVTSTATQNPAALGAATVLVSVDGLDDVDALCKRAREAGAQITEEPADQDYVERRFGATDPEGHKWFFSQQLAEVAPEDWARRHRVRFHVNSSSADTLAPRTRS